MAYTERIVGTVTSSGNTYTVAVRYLMTRVQNELKTHLLVALSVKRNAASASSTKFTDTFPFKSEIWGYSKYASVTIPTTTEWRDLIYKEADLTHNANGVYGNDGLIDIDYKWGSFRSTIRGTVTLTVPTIATSEYVVDCPRVTYGRSETALSISSQCKGMYPCKLFVSYDDETYTDTGEYWSKDDRTVRYPNLTPDVSVFGGNDYCTLYFKIYTYTDNTWGTLVAQSVTYQTRLVAGSSLKPSLTITFNPYTNGQVSVDNVIGIPGWASTHVIPYISSYQMVCTPSVIGQGTTVANYKYVEYTTDSGDYKEVTKTGTDANTYNYVRTINNNFYATVTDSNGRVSNSAGPSQQLQKLSYALPGVSISECYLSAQGVLTVKGSRTMVATQFTTGTHGVTNTAHMKIQYRVKGTQDWSVLLNDETYTSDGTYNKTFSNISLDNIYQIRVLVWDTLYQCKDVSGDGQYTIASIDNIGLKPVLEMDNNGVYLYKNTSVTGNMSASGVVHSNTDVTAGVNVTANNGRDILGSDALILNGVTVEALTQGTLFVGDDEHLTDFGEDNIFRESPLIYYNNTPERQLSNSGYCRLSNGLMLQWSRNAISSDSEGHFYITFPKAGVTPLWFTSQKTYTYDGKPYTLLLNDCTNNVLQGSLVSITDGSIQKSVTGKTIYAFSMLICY